MQVWTERSPQLLAQLLRFSKDGEERLDGGRPRRRVESGLPPRDEFRVPVYDEVNRRLADNFVALVWLVRHKPDVGNRRVDFVLVSGMDGFLEDCAGVGGVVVLVMPLAAFALGFAIGAHPLSA